MIKDVEPLIKECEETIKELMQMGNIEGACYVQGFINSINKLPDAEQLPHGECNQCRHYEGVHGVQGHAPCSFWGIGGVLYNDYCSRFEKEGEEK